MGKGSKASVRLSRRAKTGEKRRKRRTPQFLLNARRRRYHRRGVNPHVSNAILELGMARQSVRAGDWDHACRMYQLSLRSWSEAIEQDDGAWRRELLEVLTEYETVVDTLRDRAGEERHGT